MPKRRSDEMGSADKSEAEESQNKSMNINVPSERNATEEPSTSKVMKIIPSDDENESISKPQDNPASQMNIEIEQCSICLENINYPGMPNTCMHQFCFSCLKQWCEIHSSCPLCKTEFSVILHNIHDDQCDRYPILIPYYQRALIAFYSKYVSRRVIDRSRREDEWEVKFAADQLFAMIDCDLLVRLGYPDLTVPRTEVDFRRTVYRRRLWSIPPPPVLLRPSTPEHFMARPEDFQRVIQWVMRELSALIVNRLVYNRALNDIINWLKTYRLNDRWLYIRAYEYLTTLTDHFLHELKCFATSSIDDIETYDNTVQYLMRKDKSSRFTDCSITTNQLLNLTSWNRESTFEFAEYMEHFGDNEDPTVDSDEEDDDAELPISG